MEEDLNERLSEIMGPLEQRIEDLTSSIDAKEIEISTLKYTLIGLKITLQQINRISIQQIKPTGKRPSSSSIQLKPKPFVAGKAKIAHQRKNSTPMRTISPSKNLTNIETNHLIGLEILDDKVLKLTSSPIRSSVVFPDKCTPMSTSHKRNKSVSTTPSRESPSPMRNSIIGDEFSPMRDSMVSEMIVEEVATEVPKNSFAPFPSVNWTMLLRRPKRISGIDFLEFKSIFQQKTSFLKNMFRHLNYVDSFKISDTEDIDIKKPVRLALLFLQKKIRWLRIDPNLSFQVDQRYIVYFQKISIGMDHLRQYRRNLTHIEELVLYPFQREGILFDLLVFLPFLPNCKNIDLAIPHEERFLFILEGLHNHLAPKNKTIALHFSFNEESKYPTWDKLSSINWNFLTKFSTRLNVRVPESPIIDHNIASNLEKISLIIDIGCKMETFSALELMKNLKSVSLTVTLNLRGYQNFFRSCNFPPGLSELKIELNKIPAQELFPIQKGFNPHLERKFELHDYYGSFCRKIQRLPELRILSFTFTTKSGFEKWNSYLATSLINSRSRVKFLKIKASSAGAPKDEPFDLEELCYRAGTKSSLRELIIISSSIEYSNGRLMKVMQKLRHVTLQSLAEETRCAFKIQSLLDHLAYTKINSLVIHNELYALDAIPTINIISDFINLRELNLKINGENLTDEETNQILICLSKLLKIEEFDLIVCPISGDASNFLDSATELFAHHKLVKKLSITTPFKKLRWKLAEGNFSISNEKYIS